MPKLSKVFEIVLFGLIAFLFSFIPLYPKFPLENISGTFVAIRLEDLLIASLLIIWMAYMFYSKRWKELLKDKLTIGFFIFFFIGFISLISGIYLTHSVTVPHLGMFHYFRRIEFMLLLPVVFTVVKSRKQVFGILGIISVTVLLVNIYALGQRYLNWPVISTTNSEFAKGLILYLTPGARVNSTFAGHYDLAVYLMMFLVAASGLFFTFKNFFIKGWLLFLSAFSFLVLIMTAARVSFFAALIGIITTLLFARKNKFVILIVILGIMIIAYPSGLRDRLVSTITINVLEQGQRYVPDNERQIVRNRLNIPTLSTPNSSDSAWTTLPQSTNSATTASDITPGEPLDSTDLAVYRSFGIRLNIEWPRALNAFYKNPLLGTGYSSIGLATDNDILRMLGEVGLLGTLAFVLILIEIFKRIWVNLKSFDHLIRYFSAAGLALIIAFVLNGVFIDVFESSKVAAIFWMSMGLILSLEKIR